MSIHRFQIESLGRRATRSCSVVRSIMTDSRSVDPGSNPGISTNIHLQFKIAHLVLMGTHLSNN